METKLEKRIPKTKVTIIIDPITKRILQKALNVYKDVDSFTALLRRVVGDWDHYRRMLLVYKDRLDAVFKEIDRMNGELEEMKREIREIKEILLKK